MVKKSTYKKILYKEIHKHSYGNSQCAEDLAQIVNDYNDKTIANHTGRLLANFNARIDDLAHTQLYTETWIKEFKVRYMEYIKTVKLPFDVESRICNLCNAKYAKVLKEVLKTKKKKRNKWGHRGVY